LLIAHAMLVEAESARQQGNDDAPNLLRRVRATYRRLGARSFVARTDVALVLTGQGGKGHSGLLARCRRRGYRFEVERLEGVRTGFYPIHFV
jgi:predicted ATPase